MQLRQLVTFVTIVDEGTLTAAARRLHKTQGAVSHDLRTLEQELGVLLVDRSGQRASLTASGAVLLPHARELLQRVRDAELVVQRSREDRTPTLRIGVLPSLSHLLARHIAAFVLAHPQTSFLVLNGLPDQLGDGLSNGHLDLALADSTLSGDFLATMLGTEDLVVVVRHDDQLAGKAVVTPSDLIDRKVIRLARGKGSPQIADQFFACFETKPPVAVEVDDFRMIKELIRSNVGYAILPQLTLIDDSDLVPLLCHPHLQRNIVLWQSTTRFFPPSVHEFHAFVSHAWGNPDTPRLASG